MLILFKCVRSQLCWIQFHRSKRFSENKKFKFPAKIYEKLKKCQESKLFILKRSTNLILTIFFIEIIFFPLFVKNDFMKIKNSIFPPNYMRYGKHVQKKKFFFPGKSTNLPYYISLQELYLFFIHQKRVYENKKFNFSPKIYEMTITCQGTKFFTSKRSSNLIFTIFLQKLYFFFYSSKTIL